ncbi:hypothetical protein LINPERPRIM_LOCUS24484 [Linum perenne]
MGEDSESPNQIGDCALSIERRRLGGRIHCSRFRAEMGLRADRFWFNAVLV